MKIKHALLILIVLLTISCKKENQTNVEQTKSVEMPHFISGKGFKYLASYSENNGGSISIMSSIDISYTPDNRIHWLFSRNNPYGNGAYLYRKIMDSNTGSPLGDGDLTNVGGSIKYNSYDRGLTDKFGFVPYSSKIYRAYRTGEAKFKVEGEVETAEYGGYDGTAIRANFYANEIPTLHFAGNIKANTQDINTRIGAFEFRNKKIVAIADVNKTMWSYGKAHNFDKLYHGGMSFPTDLNGGSSAFGFTENKAYLFKKEANETLVIDSIAFKGVPFFTGSVVPNVPYLAKTSKDLKTTVLFCYEPDSYTAFSGNYVYSTFIINNVTNKITVGVKQFSMKPNNMDFDLQGNIFYASRGDSGGTSKIMKVTGDTEKIFAQGFFDAKLDIRNIQIVDEKVYITSLTSEDKLVSRISLFVSN